MAAVEFVKEGRIAYITINNPEARNSLSAAVSMGLQDAYYDFKDDNDLWVAILTGAGDKAFCSGADIKGFVPAPGSQPGAGPTRPPRAPIRPDQIWKPFIAAIHGYCLGGGNELAMTCDIRIAAEDAQFGQPEINIGFMPGMGGTIRLPRFVPRAVAAEMLLTGNRLNAQEAFRVGLVSRVVPYDKLMATAKEIAETIISRGPLGVRASKEAIIRGSDMKLEEGLALERELSGGIRRTEDFVEGARAFAQKRPPAYKGK
jgi:enoyl-CoA hydratase/carnithine racemase